LVHETSLTPPGSDNPAGAVNFESPRLQKLHRRHIVLFFSVGVNPPRRRRRRRREGDPPCHADDTPRRTSHVSPPGRAGPDGGWRRKESAWVWRAPLVAIKTRSGEKEKRVKIQKAESGRNARSAHLPPHPTLTTARAHADAGTAPPPARTAPTWPPDVQGISSSSFFSFCFWENMNRIGRECTARRRAQSHPQMSQRQAHTRRPTQRDDSVKTGECGARRGGAVPVAQRPPTRLQKMKFSRRKAE
jgi:hypothetical protein